MVKWWYGTGLKSSQDNQHRQQQQFDTEARMGSAHSVNPPSYESVTHQVNATGGIQINHTENGTQIVTGARHGYAESVPESSVTEDFEKDDVATQDSGWETEDTNNAISKRKELEQECEEATEEATEKGGSRPSPESTSPQLKTSVGTQNNNAGNGAQNNTFASPGNVYTFNSNGGTQIREAVFYGDLFFGSNKGMSIREAQDTITIDGRGAQVHNTEPQGQKKQSQRREKKSQGSSSPSNEDEPLCFEISSAIQNNNMGNGTQVNTFSSRYINTGTGSQFDEVHFYGNLEFRKHDKARHMGGKQDNDANSEVSTDSEDTYRPYSGTGNIHVQDPETVADVRISASGIHVKRKRWT
ncbi:hypothetical protein TCE0_039f12788 [Talaromyces pinophilus]|uniref:Uncharacterized protein n=1 Tax=Talaromyces pinophilus TaxID=128442 RepID=A0A6N4SL40_TALPI|nr:hypothetical protein TCE0_039f12788 [Talaromyces pinophilus]